MFEDAPHAYNMLIFARSFAQKILCYMAMELCKKINLRWVFLIFHFYLRRPQTLELNTTSKYPSGLYDEGVNELYTIGHQYSGTLERHSCR